MKHWHDRSVLFPKYLRLYWDIAEGISELNRRVDVGTELRFQNLDLQYVLHTMETILRAREFNVGEAVCFRLLTGPDGWALKCKPPWDPEVLAPLVDFVYRYAKLPMGRKTID